MCGGGEGRRTGGVVEHSISLTFIPSFFPFIVVWGREGEGNRRGWPENPISPCIPVPVPTPVTATLLVCGEGRVGN